MTSVFLSYAHRDEARVRVIERALRSRGHNVFWDEDIPTGENWRTVLQSRVLGCQCAIVAWTPSAAASQYVCAEAQAAADNNCLIPILLEDVELPQQFEHLQAADLRNWIGSIRDPEWEKILTLVGKYQSRLVPPAGGQAARFENIPSTIAPDRSPGEGDRNSPLSMKTRLQDTVEEHIRTALTLAPVQEDTFRDITSIRAHGDEAFAAEVRSLEKHGYIIVQRKPGEVLLERKKHFSWLVAVMLTFVFVIPALIYVVIYPFLPKVHRIYVVQVD